MKKGNLIFYRSPGIWICGWETFEPNLIGVCYAQTHKLS